ncbi:MAG: hypothetical protein AAFU56_02820 [Pseudomonadota bacterium]
MNDRERNVRDTDRLQLSLDLGVAPKPLFLERESYRYRRLMDAARLLPLIATALVLVPIFWTSKHGTGYGLIYIFFIWFGAILAAFVLSRRLLAPLRKGAREPEE